MIKVLKEYVLGDEIYFISSLYPYGSRAVVCRSSSGSLFSRIVFRGTLFSCRLFLKSKGVK